MIDCALRPGDLEDGALEGIRILHDNGSDEVDENLALLLGELAHHAKVNPFDAVLR